jgi:hypothetical protein
MRKEKAKKKREGRMRKKRVKLNKNGNCTSRIDAKVVERRKLCMGSKH